MLRKQSVGVIKDLADALQCLEGNAETDLYQDTGEKEVRKNPDE